MNKALKLLTENITGILNDENMAPVKIYQMRNNYCQWISDSTKELMKQRDEAVKEYNLTKNKENEAEAKRLKKLVTNTLKEEKRQNGRMKLLEMEKERNTGKYENV